MPYIAIVHVPDHTTACRVVERFEHGDAGRIVGLFEYPERKALKCSGTCTIRHTGAWVRDKRGFMKCFICGSRNRKLRTWLTSHLFDLLGANLYPDAPAVFRTPDGYDSAR